MNKKYLKENNLYESHKQFMRLCEWSFVPKSLDEEDDEETPQDPNQADMGQDMPQGDGMGMQGDNQPPMDGNEPPMDDEGQDMDMDFSGGDEMGGEMPPMNDEMPVEDEEVIDVDDLTNAQEELNDKINLSTQELGQVDSKISSLLQALDKMEGMISNNDSQIQSLKQEFEKRNPTQTEKLNLRSLDSYPFNVKPNEYWAEKGVDGNYSAYGDNEESPTKEYEITNNDVDDFNAREMSDSFSIDDDMNQNLHKIFGLK